LRTAWNSAQNELSELKDLASDLPESDARTIEPFILYLSGVIAQGTGDTASALTIFQSGSFSLSDLVNTHATPTGRDLAILAALNSILIVRLPDHPSHSLLTSLFSSLEPFALQTPNKNVHSAYHLVHATARSPEASVNMIKTKQYLSNALSAARETANNQLMCITLNFMSWKFFRGVVASQAEKSAGASHNLAKKGKDSLWISVADGALADTLEMQGKLDEAAAVRKEAVEAAGRLPAAMQRLADVGER
jgi:hypothetical protein